MKAIEGGLLTLGSSYWPTPSQRLPRQWRNLLAFVPDHSGASVRELHPLPVSSTSIADIAETAVVRTLYHLAQEMSSILWPCQDQESSPTVVTVAIR